MLSEIGKHFKKKNQSDENPINVIGQIKWSSRMRGYAFQPTTDSSDEIKEFIKDLMKSRKKT